MTPIAVPRKPHHLPMGPIDGKRDAASEAAPGVRADGTGCEWGRCRDRPEQHLGGWHFGAGALAVAFFAASAGAAGAVAGGLTAAFLAAGAGAAGVVAGTLVDLICSAETAPQNSNSERPKASLCIYFGPLPLRPNGPSLP